MIIVCLYGSMYSSTHQTGTLKHTESIRLWKIAIYKIQCKCRSTKLIKMNILQSYSVSSHKIGNLTLQSMYAANNYVYVSCLCSIN